MRRIVIAVMSTISSLVLLFSYHTSTNSGVAVASPEPTTDTSSDSSSDSSTDSTAQSGTTDDTTTATPAPSATASSDSSSTSSSDSSSGSGTYTGDAVNTRWGVVQVEITVEDGKITAAQAVEYPQENPRDVEINDYALPVLAQEVLDAQSANIDAISGATVTSVGYIQSLQSAIDQAHL